MATRTTRFGVGRREGHDSSPFYDRALKQVETSFGPRAFSGGSS